MVKAEEKPEQQDSGAEQVAGSSALNAAQQLREEAEQVARDMESMFRRLAGEIPKAADLGELRAHQAAVRNLVQRATESAGGGAAGAEVDAIIAERDKFKDAAARARADFLNYQDRAKKELERAEELSLRRFVSDLLPALDSMDLTLQDAAGQQTDVARLKEAIELIDAGLRTVLTVRGLERIEAKGKVFDPNVHEAVVKRPAAEGETPNSVAEELRAGYTWKGLLLRPAQVLVIDAKK